MFGWFWGLFRPRRHVFTFFDGTRQRRIDPLRALAVIEEQFPDFDASVDALRSDPAKVPVGPLRAELVAKTKAARNTIVAASRLAFGLHPLDDSSGRATGVTDVEAMAVMHEFMAWMAGAAEDAGPKSSSPGAA